MYNYQCFPYIYGGLIYKPFTPIHPHHKVVKQAVVEPLESITKEEVPEPKIEEPIVEEKVLEEKVVVKEDKAETYALALPEVEQSIAIPTNNESGYRLKV